MFHYSNQHGLVLQIKRNTSKENEIKGFVNLSAYSLTEISPLSIHYDNQHFLLTTCPTF
jgi:hypothetical protein